MSPPLSAAPAPLARTTGVSVALIVLLSTLRNVYLYVKECMNMQKTRTRDVRRCAQSNTADIEQCLVRRTSLAALEKSIAGHRENAAVAKETLCAVRVSGRPYSSTECVLAVL